MPRQGTCGWEALPGGPREGQGLLGQRAELRDGRDLSPGPHWPPTAELSGLWVQGKPSPQTARAEDLPPQTATDALEAHGLPSCPRARAGAGGSSLHLPPPAGSVPGPSPPPPPPQLQPCASQVGWDDGDACRPLPLCRPRSLSTSHWTTSFHAWNRVPRSGTIHAPGQPLLAQPHGPHCPTVWPSRPFPVLEGAGIIADFGQDPPQPPWPPRSLSKLPKFPLNSLPWVAPNPGSLCIHHWPRQGPCRAPVCPLPGVGAGPG